MPTTMAPDISKAAPPPAKTGPAEFIFGVNELRLTVRQWLIVFAIVAAWFIAMPRLWKRVEAFPAGSDYRIPYDLSKDYWLYQRRLDQAAKPAGNIVLLGDSVVWGEYVRPDGTLSHFLKQQLRTNRFINGGVNGLFPLAMEGLVENYGTALHDRKVIVHCNVLWMTSPKADLSTEKEEQFNHARLVPQFIPRIPSYHARAPQRLSTELDQHVEYFAWTGHLQNAYYGQRSIPQWTLADDGKEPAGYPNAWRNPLSPLKAGIPGEPAVDPQRGPASPRHKPWTAGGGEPIQFDWVDLDKSLQWSAFRRVIERLQNRGNDVLVIVGPFNEHMIASEQRPIYVKMCERIVAELSAERGVHLIVPTTLPSALYADASHPLTEGYALLARHISVEPAFRHWLASPNPK
jgi:DNA-binding transcriptional regulator of glucitol operon